MWKLWYSLQEMFERPINWDPESLSIFRLCVYGGEAVNQGGGELLWKNKIKQPLFPSSEAPFCLCLYRASKVCQVRGLKTEEPNYKCRRSICSVPHLLPLKLVVFSEQQWKIIFLWQVAEQIEKEQVGWRNESTETKESKWEPRRVVYTLQIFLQQTALNLLHCLYSCFYFGVLITWICQKDTKKMGKFQRNDCQEWLMSFGYLMRTQTWGRDWYFSVAFKIL